MILGDNTYYVKSSATSDCPQPCHPLSYYITNTATYFMSNATFIFMEGEHKLNSNGSTQAVVNNVDNLTLRGERGHSSTDVTIRCSSYTRGIVFNNGSIINIYGITITGCGQQDIATLLFINIASLYIHNITVYNNTYNTSGTDGGIMCIHCVNSTHNIITIANSTFTNNIVGGYGGGLYIYTDAHNNITITNSEFTNNAVTAVNDTGGGLFICIDTDAHSNITITSSSFTNNKVGYGGGMIINSYPNAQNNITITNSSFTKNSVTVQGGGLYLGTINTCITIANSSFANNKVVESGGGLYVVFNIVTGACAHNNITITNSVFNSNAADNGGGLYIYTENDANYNITIINSEFTSNKVVNEGGGLTIRTDAGTDNPQNNITITDSAFNNNAAGRWGGGLCIIYMYTDTYLDNILTITNSTFANNYGSGIFSINHITVTFTEGYSIVANNSSPKDGGGILLSGNSYLTTSNGGHVSFINNTAQRYGGAIYSTDNDYASLRYTDYSRSQWNYTDQCTVYNLLATFINNSAAKAGDNLYGGVFTLCNKVDYRGLQYLQYLFNCTNVPDTLKHAISVHPLSPVSSDPIAVCPCVNGTVDCNITSLNREVYPGQLLNISLVTVGLCGRVSPGTVVVEYDDHDHIHLISAATTDHTSTSCTTFYYTVQLINYTSNTAISFNVPDANTYIIRPINISLTILPCPLGLVVNFTIGGCVCDNDITHIPVSEVICNTSWMPYPIQRSGNNWIYHRYDYYDCTIAHIGCPFDYCNTAPVKLNLNESDHQCNFNRSGILCGQCIQGFSLMIGSNRCANCTDTKLVSVSIVIIAAVAGVVLVILLMVLNLTVSVGSINGVLLYANLVKLNESIFFSNGNIPAITQFISWCNLDMGFEYCFVDGLDGYVKTWLQFVFPLYVWFLIVVIILGCRYSGRLSRLCGRNAVPVLATLILMSYTKLSRTVTNALMMNTLQCGEYKWKVWNVDGNIDYLGGKHTALFAASLLVLVTGLVYTGLVFSSQWLQRYSGKCCKSTRDPVVRLKPLIDAYTGPFKDKYRFWTGLCLIVRLMLTVVFSFTTTLQSQLNNYIILLTVGAMIVFIAVSGRVYKDKRLAVLDIFSYVNIICLCLMTVLFTDSYSCAVSINVMVSVSVSIEILLFAVIVTVHCYLAFKKVSPNCCKQTHVPSEDELPLIAGDTEEEEGSPAHVITHREELIFDFYLTKEHP